MIKLSREGFKEELIDALDQKDYYVDNETIEKFLDLNYDEDSSITEWRAADFRDLVSEILAEEDFWRGVRQFDFHTPAEDFNWDGCCPYCGSSNVDIVDDNGEDSKYICRDCNEDFLVDNETGETSDRHGFQIK